MSYSHNGTPAALGRNGTLFAPLRRVFLMVESRNGTLWHQECSIESIVNNVRDVSVVGMGVAISEIQYEYPNRR